MLKSGMYTYCKAMTKYIILGIEMHKTNSLPGLSTGTTIMSWTHGTVLCLNTLIECTTSELSCAMILLPQFLLGSHKLCELPHPRLALL